MASTIINDPCSEKARNSTKKRLFIAYFQWLYTLFVHLLSNQSKNCPEAKKTSKNHLYLIKLSWKYIKFFSTRASAKKVDFPWKFSKILKKSRKKSQIFSIENHIENQNFWIFENLENVDFFQKFSGFFFRSKFSKIWNFQYFLMFFF